jgi:hypothetical protein
MTGDTVLRWCTCFVSRAEGSKTYQICSVLSMQKGAAQWPRVCPTPSPYTSDAAAIWRISSN